MKEEHRNRTPSHEVSEPGETIRRELDRRFFHLNTLHTAAKELSGVTDFRAITETFLLMSMGTLGVAQGFVLLMNPATQKSELASRGLDANQTALLQESVGQVLKQCITSLPRNEIPFADARVISRCENCSYCPEGIKILVQFDVDREHSGVLGLGEKLLGGDFDECETEFLMALTHTHIAAMRNAAAVSAIRMLNADLARSNEELVELRRREELTRGELDKRIFHLKTLYDTIRELSNRTDATAMTEAFLLMLSGTFGVQDGYVLLVNKADSTVHVTYRFLSGAVPRQLGGSDIAALVDQVVNLADARKLPHLDAAHVRDRRFLTQPLLPTAARLGIVFRVDDNHLGFAGLGEKLSGQWYSEEEQDLLLTLVGNFIVCLGNALSFEVIRNLNVNLEKRNVELQKTIEDLRASRSKIEVLERAGMRIRSVLEREAQRVRRVSAMDFVTIVALGLILGLVFNLANPGGVSLIPASWSRPASPTVTLDELRHKFDSGDVILVDARPPEFFEQRHIRNAVNLPLSLFDFIYMMRFGRMDPEKEIVVYGRNISRHYDEEVAYRLTSRGHRNVKVFPGGLSGWEKKGYPTGP
ncbi:MAG: rhodanese-like domain-containing protein [Syntrophobacteraceae bacterium]|nr:rhodanese-like domain-containing protein [Syntrophobacteraceae bacterium]